MHRSTIRFTRRFRRRRDSRTVIRFVVRSVVFALIGFASPPTPAAAQSPALIDAILESDPVPVSLTVELFRGVNPGANDPDRERLDPGNADPDRPTTTGFLSRAALDTFDLHRGILYPLTGKTRYAMREMIYLGLMKADESPDTEISGEELLRYVTAIIAWQSKYGVP